MCSPRCSREGGVPQAPPTPPLLRGDPALRSASRRGGSIPWAVALQAAASLSPLTDAWLSECRFASPRVGRSPDGLQRAPRRSLSWGGAARRGWGEAWGRAWGCVTIRYHRPPGLPSPGCFRDGRCWGEMSLSPSDKSTYGTGWGAAGEPQSREGGRRGRHWKPLRNPEQFFTGLQGRGAWGPKAGMLGGFRAGMLRTMGAGLLRTTGQGWSGPRGRDGQDHGAGMLGGCT